MNKFNRCLPMTGALALALLLPVGCGGTPKGATAPVSDVYVGGYTSNANGHSVATLWVNGTPLTLSDGTSDAWVGSVAISGYNVYAFGADSAGPGGALVPTMWMTSQPLDQPPAQAYAAADFTATPYPDGSLTTSSYIFGTVVGGLPYMASSQSAATQTGSTLTVWTSGQAMAYPGPTDAIADYPNGITAYPTADGTGVKVYIAGYRLDNAASSPLNEAMYWTNGKPTPLTDGTVDSVANAVAMSGAQPLFAGQIGTGATAQATLWDDTGTATALPSTWNLDSSANALAAGKMGTFLGGYQTKGTTQVATVWKRTGDPTSPFTITNLTDGSNNAAVYGLYQSGGLYAAGYEELKGNGVAKVWKDGTATALTDGSTYAAAYSVGVVVR